MRRVCFGISLAIAVLAGTAASAAEHKVDSPPRQASIHFVQHGGIRNWAADRDRGLWIQDSRRRWYYAKLMGPCLGLGFARTIAFDTRPGGIFDRFSSIIVPHYGRCRVQSFIASEGPPRKQKAPAPAKVAT
jgi:Family of unknown function (DUF6491)